VITDNGSGYVSRLFRKACRMLCLRHMGTRRYMPKTSGKAERFIQTLLREWPTPSRTALPDPSRRPAALAATTTKSSSMLVSPASHPPPGSGSDLTTCSEITPRWLKNCSPAEGVRLK
jgi:transposase InsO family protein